ncbi:hypothetical protein GCM10010270_60850 [Streptomyces violaceus]|nr:hypothetical protein GCM10010270_60850 [Streptomyces janthinus]
MGFGGARLVGVRRLSSGRLAGLGGARLVYGGSLALGGRPASGRPPRGPAGCLVSAEACARPVVADLLTAEEATARADRGGGHYPC